MKNIQSLISAAHANAVARGFWGLWQRRPSLGYESPGHRGYWVCMNCEASCGDGETPSPSCTTCGAKDDPAQRDIATKIALIHSELSEALEEFREEEDQSRLGKLFFECHCSGMDGPLGCRSDPDYSVRLLDDVLHERNYLCPVKTDQKHKPVGFMSELADVAIRLFDFAGWLGWTDFDATLTLTDSLPSDISTPAVITACHGVVAQLGWGLSLGESAELPPSAWGLQLLENLNQLSTRVGGDLQEAITTKMQFNSTRPMKHGGKVV